MPVLLGSTANYLIQQVTAEAIRQEEAAAVAAMVPGPNPVLDAVSRPTPGERLYAMLAGHHGSGPIDYVSLPVLDWRHLTHEQRMEWESAASLAYARLCADLRNTDALVVPDLDYVIAAINSRP